jgi:hypothetical protein
MSLVPLAELLLIETRCPALSDHIPKSPSLTIRVPGNQNTMSVRKLADPNKRRRTVTLATLVCPDEREVNVRTYVRSSVILRHYIELNGAIIVITMITLDS